MIGSEWNINEVSRAQLENTKCFLGPWSWWALGVKLHQLLALPVLEKILTSDHTSNHLWLSQITNTGLFFLSFVFLFVSFQLLAFLLLSFLLLLFWYFIFWTAFLFDFYFISHCMDSLLFLLEVSCDSLNEIASEEYMTLSHERCLCECIHLN